ncbi:MAG: protein translocase subunit SecDF [Bacteroidetes bacterium]|nr:protein translocase subunit SecDF [Bacteroidota bacterium]
MQNKGAIKIFAILLALACIFYLSFTWKTRAVEAEAMEYAESVSSSVPVTNAANKFANTDSVKRRYFIDSIKVKTFDHYLDSVKTLPVYSLGFTSYTYEECKKREINLGLDLRGGMNVTLEVSVQDIIKNMSNNSEDKDFKAALESAQSKLGVNNNDDFVTLFDKEYRRIAPNGRLAPIFSTIENKGKLEYSATNDQVIAFIRTKVEEAISNSEKTFRSRIDRFGVAQPNIQKLESSGRILVELPGVKDKERVRELLQGTANLEFWETYDNEEVGPLMLKANEKLSQVLFPDFQTTKDTTKAIDTTSVKNASVAATSTATVKEDTTKKGKVDSAALAVKTGTNAAAKDTAYQNFMKRFPLYYFGNYPGPLKAFVTYNQQNQQPERFIPGAVVARAFSKEDTALANKYLRNEALRAVFPSKLKFMWSAKAKDVKNEAGDVVGKYFELYAIKVTDRNGKAALYGDIITDARKDYDQKTGGHPFISMSMNSEAAEKWKRITGNNAPKDGKPGHSIAVVMDNMVYSAPVPSGEIAGGNSQITGDFSNDEADALVAILSAGKLPAQARIVEENIVGPTLGQEAIDSGLMSFAIALVVILVFMFMYYNKAGMVANIALIANMFFIMGILTSLGAVLTLPGIAGIVLTIGLAVDANILIFERVREELALGKNTSQAIKEGFKHAMSSIIDSNVTLAILAVILMVFGTGPVQGFATTLLIGIGASLFSAILITRVIFDWMLERKMSIPFDNNATRNSFKNIHIDFVGKRKVYYIISSLIIVAGAAMFVKHGGLNLGVDFKGGRTYQVRFEKEMNTENIKQALAKPFESAPEVKTLGSANQVKITTTFRVADNNIKADSLVDASLKTGLNTLGTKYEIMSQQKVGPTIATDIVYGAYGAILFSCLLMFIYIIIRFKKWQYGLGSVVALFHDVLVVLSFYTIFDGILPFSLEIGQDFIAAILTVMGYTMTETVVVFDRIREKLAESGKSDVFGEERNKLINFALNSTLSRTILTSLTVFFVLLVIFIFGGESIRGFIFALLIGRIIGTYSSLCISTPIVVDFDKRK